MNPSVLPSRIARLPALQEARIAGSPIANVLNAQLRFSASRSPTDPTQWDLAPETSGARDALAGPEGDRMRALVTSSIESVDSQRPTSLTGISLAVDEAGFAANLLFDRLLGDADFRREVEQVDSDQGAELLTTMLQRNAAVSDGAKGVHTSGRISLSRLVSADLAAAAADPVGAPAVASHHGLWVLGHELEHTVTPRGVDGAGFMDWLEEGTAEALSLHPTVVGARARAARVPQVDVGRDLDAWLGSYRGAYDSVHRLLRAAGVDAAGPAGATRAADLLQGAPIRETPARIAAAIGQHHTLDPATTQSIEQRIIEADGAAPGVFDWLDGAISPRAGSS